MASDNMRKFGDLVGVVRLVVALEALVLVAVAILDASMFDVRGFNIGAQELAYLSGSAALVVWGMK